MNNLVEKKKDKINYLQNYQNDIEIKYVVLGTRKEKGEALENNISFFLQKLGWECHTNVKEKSSETDVLAYHSIFPNPLYIECKAHVKPIGAEEIDKFISKFSRLNESVKFGWFISLSGFKNGVENSFKNVTNIILFDGLRYYQFLKKNKFIIEIEKIIKNYRISAKEISNIFMIIDGKNISWVVELTNDLFIFESATKDQTDELDFQFIKQKFSIFPLEEENKIRLVNEWEIINMFLDLKTHFKDEISKSLHCSSSTVEYYVDKLVLEKILVKIDRKIILNDSFITAEKIVQMVSKIVSFENFPKFDIKFSPIYDIGRSNFYKSNSARFTKRILKKFNISEQTNEEEEILNKILRISPLSICYCFGELDRAWEKGPHKMKALIQFVSILVLWDALYNRFDLFKEIDDHNKLILFNPSIEIKFASKNQIYLNIQGYPTNIALMKLKKNSRIILRGDHLKAADDILLNDMGGLLMSTGQFEAAIECFQSNIKYFKNTIGSLISIVNLMACFMNTKNPQKAIEIYTEYNDEIRNKYENDLVISSTTVNIPEELKKVKEIFEKNYSKAKIMLKTSK